MSTTTDTLTLLREDLIAAGLVRRPSEAGAGIPPMHVEPPEGAIAPGDADEPIEDDATLVVSIMASGDLGETPEDSYRRRSIVDVRYRSRTNPGLMRAAALDAAIRARLTSPARNYGRGFALEPSGVIVLEASQFAGFGPIDRRLDGTTPLFTHGSKYALEVLA